MVKTALLLLFVPALCLTQSSICYFPPAAPLNQSCAQLNSTNTGCLQCNTGYQLMVDSCYPPCPTGWTELMPSYCLNSSYLANDPPQFGLCPTNNTQQPSGSCYQNPDATCPCGPPCPTNYVGQGCECVYSPGQSLSEYFTNKSNVLPILLTMGAVTVLLGMLYVGSLLLKKKNAKYSQEKLVQVESYIKMAQEKV